VHPHGVVEDEDVDSLEDKPLRPPNRDTSPRIQDKQTLHTSFVINVVTQVTTPGTAQQGRLLEPLQRI
jgi:hypothetical protein